MKDQETVQKFIELCSRGVSFARIAEQLGVAKSTLILWSREHQHLIQNLRTIEWEEFVDNTLVSKQERLKALAEQLRRLDAELAQRDLASIPTARLQTMARTSLNNWHAGFGGGTQKRGRHGSVAARRRHGRWDRTPFALGRQKCR